MEQYIPKSVVLDELKKRRDAALMRQRNLKAIGQESVINEMIANELNRIISLINHLEVKEVDLEEKVESWMKEVPSVKLEWGNVADAMRDCARHFFELGLKAQHSSIGISNIDDIFEENGIDPDSKDAKILKECYYMALEKLKVQKGEQ